MNLSNTTSFCFTTVISQNLLLTSFFRGHQNRHNNFLLSKNKSFLMDYFVMNTNPAINFFPAHREIRL